MLENDNILAMTTAQSTNRPVCLSSASIHKTGRTLADFDILFFQFLFFSVYRMDSLLHMYPFQDNLIELICLSFYLAFFHV